MLAGEFDVRVAGPDELTEQVVLVGRSAAGCLHGDDVAESVVPEPRRLACPVGPLDQLSRRVVAVGQGAAVVVGLRDDPADAVVYVGPVLPTALVTLRSLSSVSYS